MFLWCSLSTENEQAVREKEWDAVEKSMPQMCFQSLNAHNRWFFARNKNINNCLWLHCFCLCEANAECWMPNTVCCGCVCARRPTTFLLRSHTYIRICANCFRSWHFYWNLICTWLQCVDQTDAGDSVCFCFDGSLCTRLIALAVLSFCKSHFELDWFLLSTIRCVNLINDFGDH